MRRKNGAMVLCLAMCGAGCAGKPTIPSEPQIIRPPAYLMTKRPIPDPPPVESPTNADLVEYIRELQTTIRQLNDDLTAIAISVE